MTIEDLKKGEYETVEYKQDIPLVKEKYLKTAVAFANASGGRLIFGVENNTWRVIGFSDEEVFKKYDSIANSIYDACEPSIVPIMTIEEIDGKKIIVAEIRAGMAKPYYIRNIGMMEGTYIRIAGVSRIAERYMIRELQLEGTNRGFDAIQVVGDAISEKAIKALCKNMYERAIERCLTDEQRKEQKKVTKSQLVSWKILVESNGKYYPTNAWKLLTGDTEELLPDAYIQMAAFKGNTRSVFIDRKEAKGPIYQQIEEAMLFVKKHINLGSRIDGVYREDYYELPIDSIREIISNAVCHRSYLSPGSIQLAIYDDRLEVTSPGRLNPDLTIEQIIAGNSRMRNAAIGAAFYYMHIIERWGSGIPRLFEDAKAYGLGEPQIKDFGTAFRISLNRKTFEVDPLGIKNPMERSGKGEKSSASNETEQASSASNDAQNNKSSASNEAEQVSSASNNKTDIEKLISNLPDNIKKRAGEILKVIMDDPSVTSEDIGKKIVLSRATVQRSISEMKSKRILYREGSNNGGKWVINMELIK